MTAATGRRRSFKRLNNTDVFNLRTAYYKVALASLEAGRTKTRVELANEAYQAVDEDRRPKEVSKLIGSTNSTIGQVEQAFIADHGMPWKELPPKQAFADVQPSEGQPALSLELANQLRLIVADEVNKANADLLDIIADSDSAPVIDLTGIKDTLDCINVRLANIEAQVAVLTARPVRLPGELPTLTIGSNAGTSNVSAAPAPAPVTFLDSKPKRILVVGAPSTQKASLINKFKTYPITITLLDNYKSGGTSGKYDLVIGAQTMNSGLDLILKNAFGDRYVRINSGGSNSIIKRVEDFLNGNPVTFM